MLEFKVSQDSILKFVDTNSSLHNLSEDLHQAVLLTINNINEDSVKEDRKVRESLIDDDHFNNSIEVY